MQERECTKLDRVTIPRSANVLIVTRIVCKQRGQTNLLQVDKFRKNFFVFRFFCYLIVSPNQFKTWRFADNTRQRAEHESVCNCEPEPEAESVSTREEHAEVEGDPGAEVAVHPVRSERSMGREERESPSSTAAAERDTSSSCFDERARSEEIDR